MNLQTQLNQLNEILWEKELADQDTEARALTTRSISKADESWYVFIVAKCCYHRLKVIQGKKNIDKYVINIPSENVNYWDGVMEDYDAYLA